MLVKALLLLFLVASLSACGLCYSYFGEFYVKPAGFSGGCPSGDSPCHSLQYYANHSSFNASNSMFIFLEGEHHLDSLVNASNVANLSLVGASSRVKILCLSQPTGFCFEEFSKIYIENITFLGCGQIDGESIYLAEGSEVTFNHINISITSKCVVGLHAVNIVGNFTISNSFFLAYPSSVNVVVEHYDCDGPVYFRFSRNELISKGQVLVIVNSCSDVQMHISHCLFTMNSSNDATTGVNGLLLHHNVSTSNFAVHFSNNVFMVPIDFINVNKSHCSQDLVWFTNETFHFHVHIVGYCNVTIEDSVFSGQESFHMVACYPHNTTIRFINCSFENCSTSAIIAQHTTLVFAGRNKFQNNSGLIGGAIRLNESSIVYLEQDAYILFEENHAAYAGGAIYMDYTASDPHCFFNTSSIGHPLVAFRGNTASFAGSSLYGEIRGCCSTGNCEAFKAVFNITNTETDPSAIASDPYQACFCLGDSSQPNCSIPEYDIQVFPGQAFSTRLAVVGSGYDVLGSDMVGVVRGAVRAYLSSSATLTLGSSQESQVGEKPQCGIFYYSIYGAEGTTVILELAPEQNFVKRVYNDGMSLGITVHLMECPAGFVLSNSSGGCVCDPSFDKYSIECSITNQSFLCPASSWLGFINGSTSKLVVVFARNCPFGYCKTIDVNITLNTSDSQCRPHRTGLLCGECEEGYSLTLGDGKCSKCSNTHLLLLLPLAVAGLLLVVMLFALNLTVTEGSINGLIFYSNIMRMSNSVQFREGGSQFLHMFLAWVNLDLGITMCLYDGMDGYSENWLEFAFPAYLFFIVIAIILFYRRFPALAHRIGGENAVKVIVTPLLLFYTKLLQTVATILSFQRLEDSDNVVHYVWQYDANVEYFKGKHLYLGIAGILALTFTLPYALCLTFFQQLQAWSGHRLFQWVNQLKPVFDAYAGPYKDKYRFWTGMLLLVRMLLITLFTINYSGSVEINLLIVSAVSCALLVAQSAGIYKKWPCNFLETFFYVQLIAFTVGAIYARHNNMNVEIVTDTSIALSLIVFLVVCGYHVVNRICTIKNYLKGYAELEEDMPHVRDID